MNLQELKIAHSNLLEHYQFIEMHLEGIYAVLSGKSFFSGLEDVKRLHNDIRTAVQMRDFLYNKYMELLESLRM